MFLKGANNRILGTEASESHWDKPCMGKPVLVRSTISS